MEFRGEERTVPNVIIVGAQWGDEGKAKVVDFLTEKSDVIIRFQGGANAGHTVIHNDAKFVFHMVPSGILYPNKICIVGNGVVFDPAQFLLETDELAAKGVKLDNRLFVSDQAHLVLPYHKIQDKASEAKMAAGKIGTTGRGIGPAYADKAYRTGIRVGDLRNWEHFVQLVEHAFDDKKEFVEKVYCIPFDLKLDTLLEEFSVIRSRMLPYIDDTSTRIFKATKEGKKLLFEGAQGTFLDIDHGTYPFVTSSNTIAGSACTGSGVGPTAIDEVVGIVKTYTTRVGNGPFPTELLDDLGEKIRTIGGEFGATTGRPRRCGWFDSVMLRKAIELNGITRLALTKLDVLDGLPEVKICTHYMINGIKTDIFPSDPSLLAHVIPVYETLPGWNKPTATCSSIDEFPIQARNYIERLKALCYSTKILIVSTGPQRLQTIEVDGF